VRFGEAGHRPAGVQAVAAAAAEAAVAHADGSSNAGTAATAAAIAADDDAATDVDTNDSYADPGVIPPKLLDLARLAVYSAEEMATVAAGLAAVGAEQQQRQQQQPPPRPSLFLSVDNDRLVRCVWRTAESGALGGGLRLMCGSAA
jgi:hypothetical protein